MCSANVLCIQALEELVAAWQTFGAELESLLHQARWNLDSTLQWLQSRRNHWRLQVELWKQELRQARTQQERENALTKLREAETELAKAELWLAEIQKCAEKYLRKEDSCRNWMRCQIPAGEAFLKSKIAILVDYASKMGSGEGGHPP